MKVLHLISGGDCGGALTHVLTLLKRLIKDGIDAELLCIMDGPFTKEAKKANIPIKIIYQKKRYSLKPMMDIKKYIENGGYDLVHCHGARANYIALFIKNKLDMPFATTLHSDYMLDFKDKLYKQIIFMPINAIALRRFKYILTVTKSFQNMLKKRGFRKNKLFVIYNGISFDREIDIIPKDKFLEKYNIKYDKDKIYIGVAARLQLVKGLICFLKASKEVLKTNKNIVFLIAGSGNLEKSMKDYIKENNLSDNVHMLGFVKDIESFYNVLDINMLTSYSESFPYALLEGAMMKKATIATAVGGVPEMIVDGKTGLLVKPNSYLELYEKMNMLISDKHLISKFGESMHEYIYNNFSDKKMAKKHIEIYKEILSDKNKGVLYSEKNN